MILKIFIVDLLNWGVGGGIAGGLLMDDFEIVAVVTIFSFRFDILFYGLGFPPQSIGFRQDVNN